MRAFVPQQLFDDRLGQGWLRTELRASGWIAREGQDAAGDAGGGRAMAADEQDDDRGMELVVGDRGPRATESGQTADDAFGTLLDKADDRGARLEDRRLRIERELQARPRVTHEPRESVGPRSDLWHIRCRDPRAARRALSRGPGRRSARRRRTARPAVESATACWTISSTRGSMRSRERGSRTLFTVERIRA